MSKLFVFLPCYNEELNIGELIDCWMEQSSKLFDDYDLDLRVFAIDDCSKDNTKGVILEKEKQYPSRVKLISHEVNKNLCGGLNTSISYFLKNGNNSDLMCLMDGDNSHSPAYIHQMLEKLSQSRVDCVIASRYCDDSSVRGLSLLRKSMSDFAKIYYTLILRVPNVKDYTCGYRVYKYGIIEKLVNSFDKKPIKEKSFACMMEFLYKLYLSGAAFDEVGFELRYDKKLGESKMNVKSTMVKSIKTAIKLKKLKKKQTRV